MALPIKKKVKIKTERLSLKSHAEQDIDSQIDLLTNPGITSAFMVPEMESRSSAEELVRKMTAFSQTDDTEHLEYDVYLGDQIIGFINDCGITDHEIEIGYVIHPHKGHGYATEVVRAVISELREMGFRKVTAGYFPKNTASLRVMEKCGMQKTAVTDALEYRGKHHACGYCEICF